jgi:hypothetical protein
MTPQRKLKPTLMKHFLIKKYTKRGQNRRVNRLGGWGAIAERQLTTRLARQISDEIDKQILKQLIEYVQTDIHS